MIVNEQNLLPIGTVISIKGGKNLYCIIGYYPIAQKENLCDYIICNATYGVVNNDLGVIDGNCIRDVIVKGYEGEEHKTFKKALIKKIKDFMEIADKISNRKGEQENG